MSALENLTAKIVADSEAEAEKILSAAQAEADQMVAAANENALREKERLLADAEVDAAREKEQIIVGKTLEVRDANLAAKQEVLDRVFAEALIQLNKMDKETYFTFLARQLSKLDLDGEELQIPAKYGVVNIDELNAALKKAGKKGNLKLSDSKKDIEGGFILRKGGIEQNNTFEALVAYYRYELESEVISTLY